MSNRNTGRDVAVLAAGIAAGMLGSRLFPPLMAMASGSMRGLRGKDPFELLIADHREIQSLLEKMQTGSADSTARRTGPFLALKRTLAKHVMAEEDVVYPLLHNQAQDSAVSKELYEDHADIKILLFEIEGLLLSGQDWSRPVAVLQGIINEHIAQEEDDVFPRLRQILADRTKASGQVRSEESLVL